VKSEFTALIEKDEDWFVAYCPEIPEANGQGRTVNEAKQSLADAIALLFEDRRDDALACVPPDVVRDTVIVEPPPRSAARSQSRPSAGSGRP
jgi:predicted RNase H-like HicB family nuclease